MSPDTSLRIRHSHQTFWLYSVLFAVGFLLSCCDPKRSLDVNGILQDSTGRALPGAPLQFTGYKNHGYTSRSTVRDYYTRTDAQGHFSITLDWKGVSAYDLLLDRDSTYWSYRIDACPPLTSPGTGCTISYPFPNPLHPISIVARATIEP
ncbi:DUF4198 domain-containing protein [Spirosoma oryzicola]|uniref:DUF4198 domain-containing protein n=1 Tax=Spirosoma oryzicola TaxID=2898794 RepID=UPI001E54B6D3|nr:DUF4198 domain-containing protein [Spirosoma oryzicola]UHG94995.1 DUF4198 domain-containing protein [Spirosoma oryzicola]